MVASDDDGLGEETQRGFAADEGLDAYTGLYRLVLVSYGYRCALTGARFAAPNATLHADLDVAAIQPREHGGPLVIANYLPMLGSLVPAFRGGLVAIEDDYRLLVPRPELLDRDTLAALRTSIIVPDDPLFRPGAAFLAHHRRYALGR